MATRQSTNIISRAQLRMEWNRTIGILVNLKFYDINKMCKTYGKPQIHSTIAMDLIRMFCVLEIWNYKLWGHKILVVPSGAE